jgi:hypothetical protein
MQISFQEKGAVAHSLKKIQNGRFSGGYMQRVVQVV